MLLLFQRLVDERSDGNSLSFASYESQLINCSDKSRKENHNLIIMVQRTDFFTCAEIKIKIKNCTKRRHIKKSARHPMRIGIDSLLLVHSPPHTFFCCLRSKNDAARFLQLRRLLHVRRMCTNGHSVTLGATVIQNALNNKKITTAINHIPFESSSIGHPHRHKLKIICRHLYEQYRIPYFLVHKT